MPTQVHILIFYLLAFAHFAIATDGIASYKCDCTKKAVRRSNFPKNFTFGAGGSAYQIEGAYNIDGKGPNIWDTFTHSYPERIQGKSNGDKAIDSYHRYKEDVRIAKQLGLDTYRFSISWSRVLPTGRLSGGVNELGIKYYNNLINELIANDIKPCVTMFHWDVPQALEDAYGGFLSPRIVDDFLAYADLLFKTFGDRVETWITLNEPWSFSVMAYVNGLFPPGRCTYLYNANCMGGDSSKEPYKVTHNQLLAHAAAVNLYRKKYQEEQKGMIGITLVTQWYLPYNASKPEDRRAVQEAMDFNFGWFMNPIAYGDYPASMKRKVGTRLPSFTEDQTKLINGSYDFLGLNYYTASFASPITEKIQYKSYSTDSGVNLTSKDVNNHTIGGGPAFKGSWLYMYPKGLKDVLRYIKRKYKNPKIFITENGVCRNGSLPMFNALNDTLRKDYMHDHLCCVQRAIDEDEVNVQGVMIWSLEDNFEWIAGYEDRFGLYYVDFTHNLERIPKISAMWLQSIIFRTPISPPPSLPPSTAPSPVPSPATSPASSLQQNVIKMLIKNRKIWL